MVAIDAPSSAANAQQWMDYRSATCPYRVDMPGQPMLATKIDPLPVGGNVVTDQASVQIGSIAFLVRCFQYPPGELGRMPPEQVLAVARDSAADGHKLLVDRPFRIGDFAAREFIVEQDGNFAVVTLGVVVGNRVYHVIVAGPGPGVINRDWTRRFLDSFDFQAR